MAEKDSMIVPGFASLAEEIHNQRFEGLSNDALAAQVDAFHGGDGIGSIGAAVTALKALAQSFIDTDAALRDGLRTLGVNWEGAAASQAQELLADKQGFAKAAESTLNVAAEHLFAQGELFNRAKYALPPANDLALRNGTNGQTNLWDDAVGLVGIDTDNAKAAAKAQNQRNQVVDVLNTYAAKSASGMFKSGTFAAGPDGKTDPNAYVPPLTIPQLLYADLSPASDVPKVPTGDPGSGVTPTHTAKAVLNTKRKTPPVKKKTVSRASNKKTTNQAAKKKTTSKKPMVKTNAGKKPARVTKSKPVAGKRRTIRRSSRHGSVPPKSAPPRSHKPDPCPPGDSASTSASSANSSPSATHFAPGAGGSAGAVSAQGTAGDIGGTLAPTPRPASGGGGSNRATKNGRVSGALLG